LTFVPSGRKFFCILILARKVQFKPCERNWMHHVRIIGTGSYVPKRVLTNSDLEKMVETTDQWIMERTGIRERRIADENETNVSMGGLALERAIENACIDPTDIDMLVVGTNTTGPGLALRRGPHRSTP